ncbi:MAG: GFA family protein [Janthinobacterium lividum]
MTSNGNGRCFCRGITFRLSAEPISFVVCHCRDCQYASGGSPACVLVVPATGLDILDGKSLVADYRSMADSGRAVTRHFCSRCGTPMFETLEADPTIRLVKAGTLDEPGGLKVDATAWTDSAQPWAMIDPETEQFRQDLVFPFVCTTGAD